MAMTNHPAQGQISTDEIRARASPVCGLCGSRGELIYSGLSDRLFGAPGTWTLKQCPRPECALAWMDPMPLEQDIGKAYFGYHTHEDSPAPRDSWPRRYYNLVKQGYVARKYGYKTPRSSWRKALGLMMYLVPSRRALVDAQFFFLP